MRHTPEPTSHTYLNMSRSFKRVCMRTNRSGVAFSTRVAAICGSSGTGSGISAGSASGMFMGMGSASVREALSRLIAAMEPVSVCAIASTP